MAPDQETQLEKVIDGVLKSGNAQPLDAFLQRDIFEGTHIKCSQQFVTKLNKLVSRSLDQKDSKAAGLGLTVLCKCGKSIKLPGGGQGLSGMIAQGLVKKWFEKCRHLWIQCGPQWNESLFNLSEDLFDALVVVHEACKEGTYKITESFLYPIGQLGVDPRIYILIQKEAIRKFNLILDKMPVELKNQKKILTPQEASDIMIKLAGQILKGGDYDLQTALMEALCRMATPDQRKNLADRWFSMAHVANAFAKIRDSEFETDCRKFLNLVNGMQGDGRRVYSYPCLEVYLDKYELLMPADDKLEEFWIDFNLSSHSISFYFSLADEETEQGQWETLCISENEVESYTVTEKGKRKVLQLKLSEVVVIGAIEGSSLTIHFSSPLDILQAALSVYGHNKNKGFVGKTSTSVVTTTVKIVMEENSSQVVPESQVSLGETEKNTTPSVQMVTPAKMRISESTTIISNSTGGNVRGTSFLSAVMPADTSVRGKAKPSLEMVRSCDRQSEFHLGRQRTTANTCSHGKTPNDTKTGAMIDQSDASLKGAAHKLTSNKVDKHKKNILAAKEVDVVLSGQREGQSLEDSFVPDTQPRTGMNISSMWNKLSISEMLMMPTQKINTLPRTEPNSSLECQSSAQKLSVPHSGPISQKQFHTRLTQRLEQVLSEKSQDCAPQVPDVLQTKTSDFTGDSKVRRSADQCSSTLCTYKEQQAQNNDLAKGKSKGKMPLKADVAPNKPSGKASTSKALQERIPSSVKAKANRDLSNKEKQDAAVAGSMMKVIYSHYKMNTKSKTKDTGEDFPQSWIPSSVSRPGLNISWFLTAKRGVSGDVNLTKSNRKKAAASTSQRKDIFAFNSDAPINIAAKDKPFTNSSVISSSDNHDSSVLHNTTKNGQPVAKEKRYVKKHLFSDTDTDYTTTEVSWLRDSGRKPKPKVNKYSRHAPVKPKDVLPLNSYKFPDLPSHNSKSINGNTKSNKKKPSVKETEELPKKIVKPASASNKPPATGRRPRRAAAALQKSYKEPDTDDTQSEPENLPVPKYSSAYHRDNTMKTHEAAQATKRRTAGKHQTKNCMNLQCSRRSSPSELESVTAQLPTSTQRPENVLQESRKKKKKKNVIPAEEKMQPFKDSWATEHTSFCPTTPCIEKMRSAERSAPTLGLTCSTLLTLRRTPLPASPEPTCQDTPEPILIPKTHSAVSSKGNLKPYSFYSAEKKCSTSKTQSIQSAHSPLSLGGQTAAPDPPIGLAAEISPINECLSPAPQSPLCLSTQPLLTSTLLELDKPSMPSPQSPFPKDDVSYYSKVSTVSLSQSSTKSSTLMGRVKGSPTAVLAVTHKPEETPPSDSDLKPEQLHMSGPSRKRHFSLSSNSEEDEKEERKKSKMRGQHSRMKPRKLFKSFTEMSAEGEVTQVTSTSHTVSSSHGEEDVEDGDMDMDEDLELPKTADNPSNLCQQFSSELKKKFQKHSKMMEVYNKQSLKTVQQHIASLTTQVNKYRSQSLEQVKNVLLEEIHKLEHNETELKNMEKNLTIFWKKQTTAFHSYQEQETRRNETLKTALQSNVCPSWEYEQKIFTSQMFLVRKDMKAVQDRLLCEMQEGEIQSVKRGLRALFFPDEARL